jgi:hypothetical protein
MSQPILVPVAAGELFDKIAILQIKAERIADADKLAHVRRELALLQACAKPVHAGCEDAAALDALLANLKRANEAIWDVENTVRACDRVGDFGPRFVEAARTVHVQNDRRAAIKLRINTLLGSALVEAKEHRV